MSSLFLPCSPHRVIVSLLPPFLPSSVDCHKVGRGEGHAGRPPGPCTCGSRFGWSWVGLSRADCFRKQLLLFLHSAETGYRPETGYRGASCRRRRRGSWAWARWRRSGYSSNYALEAVRGSVLVLVGHSRIDRSIARPDRSVNGATPIASIVRRVVPPLNASQIGDHEEARARRERRLPPPPPPQVPQLPLELPTSAASMLSHRYENRCEMLLAGRLYGWHWQRVKIKSNA